jgi:hypothetical protein
MRDDILQHHAASHADVAADVAAWARHASGANGFGDAPVPETTTNPTRRTTMQMMMQSMKPATTARYAKCVEVSKRIRWDIDRDVIRGREFDFTRKFMPDGLTLAERLPFLNADEKRFFSQVQGRTYANIFGLVERFIGSKIVEVSHTHGLGDQTAFEALVRFTDEELKHQALFRRLEAMMAEDMPAGYRVTAEPNAVASAVLSKSTWSVLGLTCFIELFTQVHYRASIEPDGALSELFKDVFLFHWKEESQHAILDELEWQRENERLSTAERDAAVDDLIALVGAVDGIVQAQAAADTEYFVANLKRRLDRSDADALARTMLAAYRWQYIGSGVQIPHFLEVLGSMITPAQNERIGAALGPIVADLQPEAAIA